MAIVRFNPWSDLVQLQERMNRLFNEMSPSKKGSDELFTGAWVPSVDIYETKNELVLKADLPEVDGKEVNIKVEDNILSISGERKMEKDITEENYHRIERAYGSFVRTFTLPNAVDRDKIKASFKDGVLRVTLPKKEEKKPKEVKIEVT